MRKRIAILVLVTLVSAITVISMLQLNIRIAKSSNHYPYVGNTVQGWDFIGGGWISAEVKGEQPLYVGIINTQFNESGLRLCTGPVFVFGPLVAWKCDPL